MRGGTDCLSPLESGLGLATCWTSRTWQKWCLKLLELRHRKPCGFHLGLLEYFLLGHSLSKCSCHTLSSSSHMWSPCTGTVVKPPSCCRQPTAARSHEGPAISDIEPGDCSRTCLRTAAAWEASNNSFPAEPCQHTEAGKIIMNCSVRHYVWGWFVTQQQRSG